MFVLSRLTCSPLCAYVLKLAHYAARQLCIRVYALLSRFYLLTSIFLVEYHGNV
jgi:hypothetical protein